MRIAGRLHEHPGRKRHLAERHVDRWRRPGQNALVVGIRRNADNATQHLAAEKRIAPPHAMVQRVAAGEQPLRDALTDDDNVLGADAIVGVEVAPCEQWHAKRVEIAGRHDAKTRPRAFFPIIGRVTLD